MPPLRALLAGVVVIALGAAAVPCPTAKCVLTSSRFRIGNGAQTSIGSNCRPEQPFYYDSGSWFKLTYNTYMLQWAVGYGSAVPSMWTTNAVAFGESLTAISMDLDYSAFVATSTTGDTTYGFGTVQSTCTFASFTVRLDYTLWSVDTPALKVSLGYTPTSPGFGDNVHLWFGTNDDYMGGSDTPTKQRGVYGTSFAQLTSAAQVANSIRVTGGGSVRVWGCRSAS